MSFGDHMITMVHIDYCPCSTKCIYVPKSQIADLLNENSKSLVFRALSDHVDSARAARWTFPLAIMISDSQAASAKRLD